MTTPLEREILTAYWTSPEGYTGRRTDLHDRIIQKFVRLGLLCLQSPGSVQPNFDALSPYMDALAAVPLPVQRWVIPTDASPASS